MSKKTFATLNDWLEFAMVDINANQPYVSVHTNHLDFFNLKAMTGEGLLQEACRLLSEIDAALSDSNARAAPPPLYSLIVLPLGYSEELVFWNSQFVKNAGLVDEPPSLYLFHSNAIFDIDDEEYKCRLDIACPEFTVLYRCHRSFQASQQGWEFSKDIYLIRLIT